MAVSAKRRRVLIALVKDHLGLTQFRKAYLLSIVGLVLLGLVLFILVSVKVSGRRIQLFLDAKTAEEVAAWLGGA